MSVEVAADLRAAADVLERDGWTQGWYHRVQSGAVCHCAEGAIATATGDHVGLEVAGSRAAWSLGPVEAWKRREAATESLDRFLETVTADWNDQFERTAAEVITALRAAADRAEVES